MSLFKSLLFWERQPCLGVFELNLFTPDKIRLHENIRAHITVSACFDVWAHNG